MDKKQSFIFYETIEEMLLELPDEEYIEFSKAVMKYGLHDIKPEFTGVKKALWTQIQFCIDNSKEKRKRQSENASKRYTANFCQCVPTSANVCQSEPTEANECQLLPNVNVNDNVNDNVNEKERENENIVFSPQPAPLVLPENYATEVFNLYTEAGLPNCQGNFIFFLQRDFKFALEVLHTKPDLRGLHSDMVLGAIKNYIAVLNNPDTWKGWKNKKSFDSFVSWERFKDFLPDRFCLDNFLEHNTPPPQTQTKGVGREEALRILHEELANGKKNSS